MYYHTAAVSGSITGTAVRFQYRVHTVSMAQGDVRQGNRAKGWQKAFRG